MGLAIGGIAAGAGALGGAALSAGAAQNAANDEQAAEAADLAFDKQAFATESENAAPWLKAGQTDLAQLQQDMPSLTKPFSMQDFQQSPGYQFQLNQGLQAMQRSAAAKGLLNSVGTQQGLNNYAQGAANTDYQQALQNYMGQNQQTYNMLSGVSEQGLQATGLINSASQNATTNFTNATTGAANAQAAGTVGTANAISGGIAGVTNGFVNYNAMSNLFGNQNQSGLNSQLLGSTTGANNAIASNMPSYTMPQLGSGLTE